jgi:pyridoxal phosphate enzyme (YggS family)
MKVGYSDISQELERTGTILVAVSKTQSPEAIMALYNEGQRDFGENRVQELRRKYEQLPKDIRWHLIGHLQSNKVKYIAPWVHLIHSVDTVALLDEINKQGEKINRVIDCLLQIHIASEETKFGMDTDELQLVLNNTSLNELSHVRICGVMGMATNTGDLERVRMEFRHLKQIFQRLKDQWFRDKEYFGHISMGMSSDYKIAVEEGSTIVRIGSLLFGDRSNAV